jgi:peptidoglycan L-alanyl-D-glutamate endopeptidase CwlK
MASRNPNDLCPELRAIYFKIMDECEKVGLDVHCCCTWRSVAEQMEMFNKGASKRKVGPHNYKDANGNPNSKAFDFYIIDKFGKVTWSTTADTNQDGHPDYIQVGEIGKKYGLEFGGDWKTLKDYDHLQLMGA